MSLPSEGWVVLTIVAGLAWLGSWSWRGRSRSARWWVGDRMSERIVLGLIPAQLLLFVSSVCIKLTGGPDAESFGAYVAAAGLLTAVMLTAWTILLIPIPRWWAPAWFRELTEAARGPRVESAAGALAALADGDAARSSAALASRRLSSARWLGSWRGNWVHDPDSLERAHGLTGRGSVEGRLTLLADGVVFAANSTEDSLRGEPTVVEISGGSVVGARVVPARAGADGIPRRGVLYRSLWPRVVVDTTESGFVFEVMRARKVAAQIRSALVEVPR